MKKIFLVLAVVCMTAVAASAQKAKTGMEYQNLRGPFITNPFGDNWFLSIGAGIDGWVRPSKLTGEEFGGLGKIAPVYQLGIGKMLHPYYGFRVRGSYGTVKDYTSFAGPFTPSLNSTGKYDLKFNYWSVGADFLFHFSNAVGGYKEARVYNLILAAGAGVGRSNGKDLTGEKTGNSELMANFALINSFRLGKAVDLNLEVGTLVMRQGFSNEGSTKSAAGMLPSATLGFTFKFNDRKFYTVKTHVDDAVADANRISNARISDLQKELAASQAAANKANADANAARKAAAEAAAAAQAAQKPAQGPAQTKLGQYDQIPVAFFEIGKSNMKDTEVSIEYAAGVIKANPGKVYTIVGLADQETGSHQRNMELSKQRAETIRKALMDAGVDSKQLEIKALGDTYNPYQYGDLNRVVIIELK